MTTLQLAITMFMYITIGLIGIAALVLFILALRLNIKTREMNASTQAFIQSVAVHGLSGVIAVMLQKPVEAERHRNTLAQMRPYDLFGHRVFPARIPRVPSARGRRTRATR